jgi:glycosyltransferase involved in cell wall biosynthesis
METNILEIINSLGIVGGAETFSVSLSLELAKNSNFIAVILYKKNNKTLLKRLSDFLGYKIFVLNKKHHFDIKVVWEVRQIIIRNKITVIHTENNALLTAYFSTRFLKKKPKIFHTIHNPAGFENEGFISRFFYRHIFKRKIAIPIGISPIISEGVKDFYGISYCPCINNGVDIERFFLGPKLANRSIDCITIARMVPQKNYPFVLSVFEECHKIDPKMVFHIFGDGPLKDQITLTIIQKNMSYVFLDGLTDRPEERLRDSKVFFLGSSYEGNPMSVLEALSCGCIPVLTNVGGIPDIIKNGKNGFLFSLSSANLIARKILEICHNPLNFEEMSTFNSSFVVKYSFYSTATKYFDLFDK